MKRIVSVITAAAAVAALSVSASAYTIDKDLGTLWSYDGAPKIAGSEFEGVTKDTTITITYEVNKDLATVENHNYWCIKPLTRDEGGDYFIEGLDTLTLSDSKDSYNIDPESTSISFKLSEKNLEDIGNNVLILMGHGITLKEMTFSNDAPTKPADPEKPVDTGVEGAAAVVGVAAAALGVVIVSRKRK